MQTFHKVFVFVIFRIENKMKLVGATGIEDRLQVSNHFRVICICNATKRLNFHAYDIVLIEILSEWLILISVG